MPCRIHRNMQKANREQRRPESPLLEKRESPQHGDQQQQLDRPCAGRMETEAAEFRNVIHQVIVLEISEDVIVKMPSIRINKRSEQGKERRPEESINKENGWTEQKAAVHVGPEACNKRQGVKKAFMFGACEEYQSKQPGEHVRPREPVNAGRLEKNNHRGSCE